MSKRKLDKTDIGEMHCWANSAFHSGFPKVQVDSDHVIELCERALDNDRLIEENAKLRGFLESLQLDVSNEIKLEQLLNQLKDQNNDK